MGLRPLAVELEFVDEASGGRDLGPERRQSRRDEAREGRGLGARQNRDKGRMLSVNAGTLHGIGGLGFKD
jgi:hypothetical protein